jgi:hypothetical protein
MKRPLILTVFFLSAALSAEAARSRAALPILAPNRFIEVGAEQALSDDVSYGPGGGASAPRIAVGPSQSLVVWRNNQAARIGPAGELLDVTPIPVLPSAPYGATAWDAVWDGSRYIVVTSSDAYLIGPAINLVFVSTAGRVESVRRVDILLDQFTGLTSVALSQSGNELALLYDTNDQTHGIEVVRGLLLSPQGDIRERFTLGPTSQTAVDPSFDMVASPAGYLALWGDQAAFVAHATGAITPARLPVVNVATAAVWNGNAFFVVATGATGVYGFELTAADVSGPLIPIHSSPFGARHPAVAYGNGDYRILWKESGDGTQSYYHAASFDLFTAVVTSFGSVLGAGPLEMTTDSTDQYSYEIDPPAVGSGNGSIVAVWTRQSGTSIDSFRNAYTAVLRGDEVPSPDAFAARVQLLSRAASTETLFSLVPQQGEVRALLGPDQDSGPQIKVVDIGREARADAVALSPQIPNAHDVIAASNGVDTTLVWGETDASHVTTVWAGEMDKKGQVVSRFPLPVTNPATLSTLVCGPLDCAVGFSTIAGLALNETGYLQRIAPNGAPLYSPVHPPGPFTIAPLGNDYLVVMRFESGISNATTAARLIGGTLSDVTYLINESTYGVAFVISRGSECLVAIRRENPQISNAETDFFRIDVGGNVVGTSKVALPPATFQVWDGRNWLIAWTASNVVAARISADLSHVDVVTLVGAASQPSFAKLVSIGDGTSALAYYRPDFAPKYGGARRMFVRWLDDRP